jgi:hypothetical protein
MSLRHHLDPEVGMMGVMLLTIIHLRPKGYVFSDALFAVAGARVNGRTVPFATRGVGDFLPSLVSRGQGLNAKTVPEG